LKKRTRRTKPLSTGWRAPRVIEVREKSPFHGLVDVGDDLLAIDGRPPLDILDCLRAADVAKLSLRLARDGNEITARVKKEEGEPLGLVFDEAVFDGVHTCHNRCLFCFVDQMPPGLRPALYIKDDDYRLSFYYGNFITLNNLSSEDLERILDLRLSPLYVSLHSTNPQLRGKMMGGEGVRGLQALKELFSAGIEVHLQVVSCPGINDAGALEQTLKDVLAYYGNAASLGVVPVSISRLAQNYLKPHDRHSASQVIDMIERYQDAAIKQMGRRIFFAADEFFLMAERDLPTAEEYEGYPQLENGIGMARKFIDEAREYVKASAKPIPTRRGLITGKAGEPVIRKILEDAGTHAEVLTIENKLFGPRIIVTSLISGADIVAALDTTRLRCKEMLIPDSMMRDGKFLDDYTLEDIARKAGVSLIPIEVNGGALLEALSEEGEF
jgi:putative radical SAM enzyme (TIGR03279 family)